MSPTFRLLSFFLCALLLAGCQPKPHPKKMPPTPVVAFQVEAQTLPADFQFVGVAQSSHLVEIRARVEGYLDSINYTEGGKVEENAVLFQLDSRPFQASLAQAQGALEQQKASLWEAQQEFERLIPLYEQNAASRRDRDNATAQLLMNEAALLSAQANVDQAALNLGYTTICSPVKGIAGQALYREGTLITPSINGLLTQISVIDPIWIYFNISDNELLTVQREAAQHSLNVPDPVDLTVSLELADGTRFPYTGKIDFTSPTLDPMTGTMNIRAVFPNPESLILPGQFVRATVSGAQRPNALIVPQKALMQGGKGMFVYVIDAQNKVSTRAVEAGGWYKEYWIINQGLKSGETVVVDGLNKLREGAEVQVTKLLKAS